MNLQKPLQSNNLYTTGCLNMYICTSDSALEAPLRTWSRSPWWTGGPCCSVLLVWGVYWGGREQLCELFQEDFIMGYHDHNPGVVCVCLLTCKRSLACCYWTRGAGPDLPGSTPCGRAFLGSVKGENHSGWSVMHFLLTYKCFTSVATRRTGNQTRRIVKCGAALTYILRILRSRHRYES